MTENKVINLINMKYGLWLPLMRLFPGYSRVTTVPDLPRLTLGCF